MCILFLGIRTPVCLPLGQYARASLDGKYALSTGWGATVKGKKTDKTVLLPTKICMPKSVFSVTDYFCYLLC